MESLLVASHIQRMPGWPEPFTPSDGCVPLLLHASAPAGAVTATVPDCCCCYCSCPATEARFVAEDPATFKAFKTDYDRSRSTLTRTGRGGG